MAYLIQCHIVDEDAEEIGMTVNFYGRTEAEAQERYDAWYEKNINLAKLDDEALVVQDEGEIPDDELPELEVEEEAPKASGE